MSTDTVSSDSDDVSSDDPIAGGRDSGPSLVTTEARVSFGGMLEQPDDGAPPDPQIAVGPSDIVEVVNHRYAVFNKTGKIILGPYSLDKTFIGSGLNDPRVMFDGSLNRFVFVALTNDSSQIVLSVSNESTATNPSWENLLIDVPGGDADYPLVGANAKGIYWTVRQPDLPGYVVYAMDEESAERFRAGRPPVTWWHWVNPRDDANSIARTIQPSNTLRPDMAEYALSAHSFRASDLTIWKFTWKKSSKDGWQPTLSQAYLPVKQYDPPPDPKEPNGTTIDWRDTGIASVQSAQGHLVSSQTVNWGPVTDYRSGVRVYDVTLTGGSPTEVRNTDFGSDGLYDYNPAAAMSADGRRLVVVYTSNSASPTNHGWAKVRYRARVNGTWEGNSHDVKFSEIFTDYDPDHNGHPRWGDLAAAAADGGSVWITNEYAETTDRWGTWIARVDQ
ncbi:MAG: hypothetical protein ABR600_05995 [Actinomycetota bacterium]|nr:hypothetical protein [Actinomycetota bacterium]